MDTLLFDTSGTGLDDDLQNDAAPVAERLPTVAVLASSLALARPWKARASQTYPLSLD